MQILVAHSRFFAVKLSNRWLKQQRTSNPYIVKIADCDDIEVYLEALSLMYCKDLRKKLMKEDVTRVLGILKTRLGNPEVRKVVDQSVQEYLTEYLELHPDVLDSILSKSLNALAAKKARELVRQKSVLRSSSLPRKLADCSATNPEHSRAVLPLRGKILNIERKDEAAMYKNEEIQNLILGLGVGVKGEDFKKEALCYHKIIILTDADVDDAHIRTLLLTFFFRYQGNKIRLWNKGVDSESFYPKYRSQEMRIRLSNGEPERPLIVHVGRLGVEKSLDLLKMSWTRYRRHKLLLLEMDHTEEDLEKLFSGMPAVFTGTLGGEELSQAYASGDVFAMPSESETLGHIMSFSENRGISYSKLANLSPIVGLCELKLNLAVGPVSIATSFRRMNT
ncbi:unnamed protein product [Camellia sinensis]